MSHCWRVKFYLRISISLTAIVRIFNIIFSILIFPNNREIICILCIQLNLSKTKFYNLSIHNKIYSPCRVIDLYICSISVYICMCQPEKKIFFTIYINHFDQSIDSFSHLFLYSILIYFFFQTEEHEEL